VDINADGIDDFVCVTVAGDAYHAVNQKDGSATSPPTFVRSGATWKANEGFAQDHVVLGDVDGDGRCDYCGVNAAGEMYCWRNSGTGEVSTYYS